MNVRIVKVHGERFAYIKCGSKDLQVYIDENVTAKESLLSRADEMRKKAASEIARADILEQAASLLK